MLGFDAAIQTRRYIPSVDVSDEYARRRHFNLPQEVAEGAAGGQVKRLRFQWRAQMPGQGIEQFKLNFNCYVGRIVAHGWQIHDSFPSDDITP